MSQNLIDYWRNIINNEEQVNLEPDGFIFKYTIVNMFSNEGVKNWVSCNSWKKLFSFVKYVILPSVQLSRVIGWKEETVVFGVFSYKTTVNILENCKIDGSNTALAAYKEAFQQADELEKGEFPFSDLKEFVLKMASDVDLEEGIYVSLDVFESIRSVGEELIEDYDNDNMLDYLEDFMEMSKEEILELFENINDNPFMKKKILSLLNERFTE